MNTQKVAIMYGRVDSEAPADEMDVLVQVGTVRSALRRLGYETMDVPVSLDLGVTAAVLRGAEPAFVFNLIESIEGKGRLISLAPCLLECLGIPYSGAQSDAIYLTSHKLLAKKTLEAAGIATPAWAADPLPPLPSIAFPPPYILKSVWEHASVGLEDSSVLRDLTDGGRGGLASELARRKAMQKDGDLYLEAFIEGREFNLALLSDGTGRGMPQNLPPAEIEFVGYPEGKPRVVGYKAKWIEGSFEFENTPRRFAFPDSDRPLIAALERISRSLRR